ncbi:hypothetical protein GCM10027034_02190 [Ramlibacter solisilvae]|uniref:Uncharacterized protein n=1 Tax=Ramlibacter tataouinensis TaxID=94132 RepID=A0A127JNU7_9BURK|nr:hypothetical protein [Ramlibacter tataouinensis]AMO21677.1 hypothetical protein UC35_00815 [Ramlibacter tataouinensis]
MPASQWRAGDWVQVRSREEILATLDEQGRLDGMPFMPEMLAFCGQTLRVFKRAHKTCDTIAYSGIRKLERTVQLEVRCDGSAHGGCEAACSLFWNEAWLRPAAAPGAPEPLSRATPAAPRARGCSIEQLMAATQQGQDPEKGPRYACQATEILNASQPMSNYDMGQYVEDYRSGNVGLGTLLRGTVYRVSMYVLRRADRWGRRIGLGDALARAVMAGYDLLQRLLPHGIPFPRRQGLVPSGQQTPQQGLGGIGPGSCVRVKPYREILATLDGSNKTRGLYFDAEHVPYCDKEFRVRSLVNQIVDERTGYMLRFKSPSIILESAVCQGAYSDNRMFCPRSIYPYWRPIWLTPVERLRGKDGSAAEL